MKELCLIQLEKLPHTAQRKKIKEKKSCPTGQRKRKKKKKKAAPLTKFDNK